MDSLVRMSLRTNVLVRAMLLLAIFGRAVGAESSAPSSAVTKVLTPSVRSANANGDGTVPAELTAGTATLDQVKTWSASQLFWQGEPSPSLELREEVKDALKLLLVDDKGSAAVDGGGNSYLAFEHSSKGHRYVGWMAFAGLRILPLDQQGRQFLLTSASSGAGRVFITLVQLDAIGLHQLGRVEVVGCDEADQMVHALFDADEVVPATLKQVFGVWDVGSAQPDFIVKAGDTLTKISQDTGVPLGAIEAANLGLNPNKLKIGQPLKMPADE
jgi:hypothetical protein